MPAVQRLNPEIWDFWRRTQKAWADGALSPLGASFQEAAKSVLTIEQFAIAEVHVTDAIRALAPRQDEFFIAWIGEEAGMLLTNQRLLIRNVSSGIYGIHEICTLRSYKEKGWWEKTATLTTRDGRVYTYPKLDGAITDAIMQYSIDNAAVLKSTLCPEKDLSTINISPESKRINNAQNAASDYSWEDEEITGESTGNMIGAEYPVIQQLIYNRVQSEETVLAFATAITTPYGSTYWVPFIGSTLELGRLAGMKPYVLVVTDKRFLIIQYTKFSILRGGSKEVAFREFPISQIRTIVAQSGKWDWCGGDELKLTIASNEKYHFRKIDKYHATMVRDAILNKQM